MTRLARKATAVVSNTRGRVASRRAELAARRTLRRELATYTTEAEISDLLAAVEARSGGEATEIRAILLGKMGSGADVRLAS
jgi:hypothetical protein